MRYRKINLKRIISQSLNLTNVTTLNPVMCYAKSAICYPSVGYYLREEGNQANAFFNELAPCSPEMRNRTAVAMS